MNADVDIVQCDGVFDDEYRCGAQGNDIRGDAKAILSPDFNQQHIPHCGLWDSHVDKRQLQQEVCDYARLPVAFVQSLW